MISQASPELRAALTGRQTPDTPAFDGASIKIGTETLKRWKAAYRHIDEWPAALQAIDDYCAANPADNARQIARASAWLERRNFQNRNDSNEAIRLKGDSW